MSYVNVEPELLRWSIKRSGKSPQALYKKFPKLTLWIKKEAKPTLKQLENFAQAVYVPIGWLFLDTLPLENIPVPDFRKIADSNKNFKFSSELIDTLYICQRRQNWYKEHKQLEREQALRFIGSVQPRSNNIIKTAEHIRKTLNFEIEERSKLPTWKEALNQLIKRGRSAQILIMVSGIVGNNTQRKLNPKEFRGFALSDSLAPLIFINGADTLSAQMFTIGHELAHLWIDQTAISNTQAFSIPNHHIEGWCNKVSAELLVPFNLIQKEVKSIKTDLSFSDKVQHLARLVIDGSKALRKAIKRVFSKQSPVQRCTQHKRRNILEYLPEDRHGEFNRRWKKLHGLKDYQAVLNEYKSLEHWLGGISYPALSSLQEAEKETLTTAKLGLPSLLRKTLSSTNPIESAFSIIKPRVRRVRNWRSGADQVSRWSASVLLEAEKRFKTIRGYREIPLLIQELNKISVAKTGKVA